MRYNLFSVFNRSDISTQFPERRRAFKIEHPCYEDIFHSFCHNNLVKAAGLMVTKRNLVRFIHYTLTRLQRWAAGDSEMKYDVMFRVCRGYIPRCRRVIDTIVEAKLGNFATEGKFPCFDYLFVP